MTVTNPVRLGTAALAPRYRNAAGRMRHLPGRRLPAPVLIAVLIAALVPLQRSWGAELLEVSLLLVFPGVLLLRALRVPGEVIAGFPVLVPAASLAVLMASGLAVDIAGLLFGFEALRAFPLLAGAELTFAILIACSRNAPRQTAIAWHELRLPWRDCWPLLIPAAAAAGALRMNDGHGNAVAVLAVCACLGAIIWGMIRAPRARDAWLALIVFATSLAVMWGYSLRGDIVYGFDISSEYHAMHQTVINGIWHFPHPTDAYGALLAVTVLPALLHFLTGISDLMVLKGVYPVITTMFPVGIYFLARKVVDRRWAFLAAAFIVAQNTFAQELPALARQEIAMVFFIALLGVLFCTGMKRRAQWALAIAFGSGMVASHYSTTYFAVGMLVALVLLQLVVSLFRDVPRVTGTFVVALAATAVAAVAWYGPITQSASNVSRFVSTTSSQGLDLLPSASGQNPISSYLNGNTQTSISASQYQSAVARQYAARDPFVHPLPDASEARYDLRNSVAPEPPVRFTTLSSLLSLIELLAAQLAEFLGALGAIILALRKKTPVMVRQLALIASGTLIGLAAIRVSGTIASLYNQQRAFIQAFAVLGVTMGWVLAGLSGWLDRKRPGRWSLAVTATAIAALAVLFAEMSGLTGVLLGGGAATNLATSGEDYERYYTTAPEIAAAQWLGQQYRAGDLVYADRYGALRIDAETSIRNGLLLDVTPQTLDRNAWVYASTSNIVDKRARQLFRNQTVSYVFPVTFLNQNYNRVYVNGSSEVFHG